tara:strand:- start:1159 stop:1629 length:471 start_codon:yes stop_codon:yes gene_type:complete
MGENVTRVTAGIGGVILTPLKIIDVEGGDVLHGMKKSDTGYMGFGEAYFSMIKPGVIKAWKRHHKMNLNLIVPIGTVRFVLYDDRANSLTNGIYQEVILSQVNYFRLTIPPNIWVGFQCIDQNISMLLNIADIEHIAEESDKKGLNDIKYSWELKK